MRADYDRKRDLTAAACRDAGAAGVDILALALVSFDELPYFRTV